MATFRNNRNLPDLRTGHQQHEKQEAKYREIAGDIAAKIATGEIREGSQLYAKSAVASHYGVSNETARRALSVLSDYGIVEITKGSGVRIISQERAVDYTHRYGDVLSFSDLRAALEEEFALQKEGNRRVEELLRQMSEKALYFRATNPFIPYVVTVPPKSIQIGKTLLETHFWNNTLATIVAIRRAGELILSPGPAINIEEGDMLYYIGEESCVGRVKSFLGV